MITWANAHRQAMIEVARAHRRFDIDTNRRIGVFDCIVEASVVLNFQPFTHLSGAYLPAEVPGIIVNALHPLARQRFTAAHELGHFVLGHDGSVDPDTTPFDTSGRRVWTDQEKLAEAFAAWFLMPRRLVLAGLAQLQIDRPKTAADVYALALRMGTSYEATSLHLRNLKLVDDRDLEKWRKQRLRALKLSLAGTEPLNLRNDVWHLDERDNRQAIAVRAGDRLVIDLEDIPSSGYTWDVSELPDGVNLAADSFRDPVEGGEQLELNGDESIGNAVRRAFVLDVGPQAATRESHLGLRCWQPWTDQVELEFDLTVAIEQPRKGIAEEQLRIVA
jgi:Zn-dependent peptidase ImmA (M78 family)